MTNAQHQSYTPDPMGYDLPPNERFIKDEQQPYHPQFDPLGQPQPAPTPPPASRQAAPASGPEPYVVKQPRSTGPCRMPRTRHFSHNSAGLLILLVVALATGFWWLIPVMLVIMFSRKRGLSFNMRHTGWLMVIIGGIILAVQSGFMSGMLWPLLLIGLGIWFFWRTPRTASL